MQKTINEITKNAIKDCGGEAGILLVLDKNGDFSYCASGLSFTGSILILSKAINTAIDFEGYVIDGKKININQGFSKKEKIFQKEKE